MEDDHEFRDEDNEADSTDTDNDSEDVGDAEPSEEDMNTFCHQAQRKRGLHPQPEKAPARRSGAEAFLNQTLSRWDKCHQRLGSEHAIMGPCHLLVLGS